MKHTHVSAEKFILSREFFGMKLGLDNITRFLSLIGSPQVAYDTIHVAGTNGKGSTAAMLASILRAAGYKTGLFTSPHLVSLRERVRVNGRMIPRRSVTAVVDRHRRELSKRKLSFFEVVYFFSGSVSASAATAERLAAFMEKLPVSLFPLHTMIPVSTSTRRAVIATVASVS